MSGRDRPPLFDLPNPKVARRNFLGGVLSAAAGLSVAGGRSAWAAAGAVLHAAPPPSRPALDERDRSAVADLVAGAGLGGVATWLVVDAATGQVLDAGQPAQPLPPASVAKAITALYAYEGLGPQFRFATQILATRPLMAGRLAGDLILVGDGDPTLDSDHLAALLDAGGLSAGEIGGGFFLYDGALPRIRAIDATQPDHVAYNPAISGLNLNFNRVCFEWQPNGAGGYQISLDARAVHNRPVVDVAQMRLVERSAPLYSYVSEGGRDIWSVAASALGKGGTRWLPVRQPALYTGQAFQALAGARGLALPAPRLLAAMPPETLLLAQHQSAPLPQMVRAMLRHSTNLTAETLGLKTTLMQGGDGPESLDLQGSGQRMAQWLQTRHGLQDARFVDHSGLGEDSAISPAGLVQVLANPGVAEVLQPLLHEFRLEKKLGKTKVLAKTGTLNFVSALAGYLLPDGGRPMIFAIMLADVPRRKALPPEARERPAGGRQWANAARHLQRQMLARWVMRFSA